MAFEGASRTLTETSSLQERTSSAFEVSAEDWSKVLSEIDEFHTQTMLKNLPTKRCFAIQVQNNAAVVPMKLKSKESATLLRSLTAKARGHVYIQHSIVYLLYIPTILETTDGLLTLKLFNTNTGESIDIDTDAPLNEAAIYVSRWPRAIHSDDGDGIHLLISATSMGCKNNAKVGTVYPLWDDSLHKKKIYEKQFPSLRFPIEKTEALAAVDDEKLLQNLAKSRIMLTNRANKDIAPVNLILKSPGGGKAKTVDFRKINATIAPSITEVAESDVDTTAASSNVRIARDAEPSENVNLIDGVTTSS